MTAIKLCMDHNLTFLYALVTLQIAHIQVPALIIISYLVIWLYWTQSKSEEKTNGKNGKHVRICIS